MYQLHDGQQAVIVAMDHARVLGVQPGIERPGEVIDKVLGAGADGEQKFSRL